LWNRWDLSLEWNWEVDRSRRGGVEPNWIEWEEWMLIYLLRSRPISVMFVSCTNVPNVVRSSLTLSWCRQWSLGIIRTWNGVGSTTTVLNTSKAISCVPSGGQTSKFWTIPVMNRKSSCRASNSPIHDLLPTKQCFLVQ